MDEAYQGLMGGVNAKPQNNARIEMLKRMEAEGNQFYQDTFRPMAMQAKEAFNSGDMQTFGGIVDELSRASPMPYQYQMGQDGNFVETFRSSKHGGYTPRGHNTDRLHGGEVL
ncbi:MAG: hypothetical protein FWH34_02500 [Desulfovibrionaceae bacterium]|nr:hypothetical protein [Desulfovibrionaceae bacterium]